jgi:hypothetical protein
MGDHGWSALFSALTSVLADIATPVIPGICSPNTGDPRWSARSSQKHRCVGPPAGVTYLV